MTTTNYCPHCGAPVPEGAQFCPRCGKTVAVAPAVPPPVPPPVAPPVAPTPAALPAEGSRRALWWIIPAALAVIAIVIFLLLAGAPYGRDEQQPVTRAETETIGEGDASTAATATLIDEPPPTATQPPPILREEPPPSVIGEPATITPPPAQPREEVPPPAAAPPPRIVEISSDEAVAVLRGFVASRDYYGIGTACTAVRSTGYRNAGYDLEVHDTCTDRLLGLWRVDAKTREIFRQREDGRYLRP